MAKKPRVWRHRCDGVPIGRTGRTGWRAVPLSNDCALCGAANPNAERDAERREAMLKRDAARMVAHELIFCRVSIPAADRAALLAFTAELRRKHAERGPLCDGLRRPHVVVTDSTGRHCARCQQNEV